MPYRDLSLNLNVREERTLIVDFERKNAVLIRACECRCVEGAVGSAK